MSQTGRSSTVFLVDDDPSVRKALTRLIKAAGYQVEAFASARDFLEWRNGPDRGSGCLILDVRMPGLSGLDLQQELLATHEDCSSLKREQSSKSHRIEVLVYRDANQLLRILKIRDSHCSSAQTPKFRTNSAGESR